MVKCRSISIESRTHLFLLTAATYTIVHTQHPSLKIEKKSKEEEAKLLLKLYPDVTPEQADTISEIASMTRAEMLSEAPKLSSAISTRLSVELAGLLSDGFTLEEGAEVAIYPFFDADGGVDSERTYMKQVVQKYCGTAEDEDIFNAEEEEQY